MKMSIFDFIDNITYRMRIQHSELQDTREKLIASEGWHQTDYLLDGQRIFVSTVYNDRSSYPTTKVCNNTALYFQKAVAEHLRQLYTKSECKVSIGLTEKSPHISFVQKRLQQLKQLYQDGYH
jgi:regulator of replication initiation timing